MDKRSQRRNRDPVVITGLGHVLKLPGDEELPDVRPYLRVRKNRKFMSRQDILATVTAGQAVESAGLVGKMNPERSGLFLVSGYIPYEKTDLVSLRDNSTVDGHLSMEAFSTTGLESVNPLMTFKCLPNMPAFHISFNFDIQGYYMVTYPGPGECYMALDEACFYLEKRLVDVAFVAAVADQRNFLVTHHYSRIEPPVQKDRLADAAGCMILEREEDAQKRSAGIYACLTDLEIAYTAHNPFEESFTREEKFTGVNAGSYLDLEMGSARLPSVLSMHFSEASSAITHELRCRNGISARSTWDR